MKPVYFISEINVSVLYIVQFVSREICYQIFLSFRPFALGYLKFYLPDPLIGLLGLFHFVNWIGIAFPTPVIISTLPERKKEQL